MIAIGCLSILLLPLVGLALGGVLAGPDGATWGAVAGLVIGVGINAFMAYVLVKIRRHRR